MGEDSFSKEHDWREINVSTYLLMLVSEFLHPVDEPWEILWIDNLLYNLRIALVSADTSVLLTARYLVFFSAGLGFFSAVSIWF